MKTAFSTFHRLSKTLDQVGLVVNSWLGLWWVPYLILVVIGVMISLPQWQPGVFRTHDGEFHAIRMLHFFDELQRGQFPVRVVPALAYSYSYPVFSFFYPLPYYLATPFVALTGQVSEGWKVMGVVTWIASGMLLYAWARAHSSALPALVGGILYLILPFRFLTILVTGQVGGHVAMLWAALLGLSMWLLLSNQSPLKQRLGGLLLSLSVAAMLTAHLLSVIMFAIPLGIYALWLLLEYRPTFAQLRASLLWLVLGLLLASFYLIPFLVQKSWIQLGQTILIDHRQHFPSFSQLLYSPWGYDYSGPGTRDGMSFQLGLITPFVAGLALMVLLRTRPGWQSLGWWLLSSLALLIFLQLSISNPIWEWVQPLQLLQYPWRLLATTTLVTALLAAWTVHQLPDRAQLPVCLVLLSVAAINIRNYTKPWPLDWQTDSSLRANATAFSGPTDISWELMPASANPPAPRTPSILPEVLPEQINVDAYSQPKEGAVRHRLQVKLSDDATLPLLLWRYPYWQVLVNNQPAPVQAGDNFTMLLPLPAGSWLVEVKLIRTTLEVYADLLTLCASLIWLLLAAGLVRSAVNKMHSDSRASFNLH